MRSFKIIKDSVFEGLNDLEDDEIEVPDYSNLDFRIKLFVDWVRDKGNMYYRSVKDEIGYINVVPFTSEFISNDRHFYKLEGLDKEHNELVFEIESSKETFEIAKNIFDVSVMWDYIESNRGYDELSDLVRLVKLSWWNSYFKSDFFNYDDVVRCCENRDISAEDLSTILSGNLSSIADEHKLNVEYCIDYIVVSNLVSIEGESFYIGDYNGERYYVFPQGTTNDW